MQRHYLTLYTFAHFWVDFSCFYVLFSWQHSSLYSGEALSIWILLYNTIAFGLQPLIGYLYDSKPKIPISLIGFTLLALGLLLHSQVYSALISIALGNACFHVGGGSDSLRNASGKMSRSGIFVSSGALGVALGTLVGKQLLLPFFFPLFFIVLCFVVLYYLDHQAEHEVAKVPFTFVAGKLKARTVITLAAITIAIRYYGAAIIPLTWLTNPHYYFFPAIGAFAGKALGGLLADRYGARKIALVSMLPATVVMVGGYQQPYLYLVAICLYNMNMAISLCTIAAKLPNYPGLAFGITTLALLCGNYPTFFWRIDSYLEIFLILATSSFVCLYYILKERNDTK